MPDSPLTIVIPALNEADNLPDILPAIVSCCEKNGWQAIVVNDGSSDNTRKVLEHFERPGLLKVVHHKLPRGYGAAIKSGIMACDTPRIITFDADGQHRIQDVESLYACMKETDADMVVGSRKGKKSASYTRKVGKWIIRFVAKILMSVPVHDLNSGMKIYRTDLARKYLKLAPDTMAYSDIITLIFINNRHLVLEKPIVVNKRQKGRSTIRMETAFQTIMEIINMVILFNPAKIFFPAAVICFLAGLGIGIPVLLSGKGVSTGSLLGIGAGILFFLLGLIEEQLSLIRKNSVK